MFEKHEIEKLTRLADAIKMKDSPASDIVREIKSKYPEVKIQQFSKTERGYHITQLYFKNYPGEGATGFGNDPRTKERDNWLRFLRYLFKKYVPNARDIDAKLSIAAEQMSIAEFAKKDSMKAKDEFIYSKSAGKCKVTVYKNPNNSRVLIIRDSTGANGIAIESKKDVEQLIYMLQDAKDFV